MSEQVPEMPRTSTPEAETSPDQILVDEFLDEIGFQDKKDMELPGFPGVRVREFLSTYHDPELAQATLDKIGAFMYLAKHKPDDLMTTRSRELLTMMFSSRLSPSETQ